MAQPTQSRGIGGTVMAVFTYAVASVAAVWNTVMKDGTVPAIGREAIKDVRNALHEFFFGHGERFGEPGAPLNLTQGEIAADRRETVHGYVQPHAGRSPSAIAAEARGMLGHGQTDHLPSQIAAASGGIHGPEQQHGHEHDHGL